MVMSNDATTVELDDLKREHKDVLCAMLCAYIHLMTTLKPTVLHFLFSALSESRGHTLSLSLNWCASLLLPWSVRNQLARTESTKLCRQKEISPWLYDDCLTQAAIRTRSGISVSHNQQSEPALVFLRFKTPAQHRTSEPSLYTRVGQQTL